MILRTSGLSDPPHLPPVAVVLGTNEIASAIAVHLHRAGRAVVLSHDPAPPVLRRGMAFHDALWGDPAPVDGLDAIAVDGLLDLLATTARRDAVAITRMGLVDLMPLGTFALLVDARLQKYAVTPDLRPFAEVTIGLGPGFAAGVDCDAAIETQPARLGLVITDGATQAADRTPPSLGGHGEGRFVRAAAAGRWHTPCAIGSRVYRGMVLGHLAGRPVHAPMDGVLRGLVRDETEVPPGAKLIEIDRRSRGQVRWTGIDARGRTVAEATIRAVGEIERRRRGEADRAGAGVLTFTTPPGPRRRR